MKLSEYEQYAEFWRLLKAVVDRVGEVTLEPDDMLTVESAIVSLKAVLGEEKPVETPAD